MQFKCGQYYNKGIDNSNSRSMPASIAPFMITIMQSTYNAKYPIGIGLPISILLRLLQFM